MSYWSPSRRVSVLISVPDDLNDLEEVSAVKGA